VTEYFAERLNVLEPSRTVCGAPLPIAVRHKTRLIKVKLVNPCLDHAKRRWGECEVQSSEVRLIAHAAEQG